MKIIIVGGSSSHAGKTTLATQLLTKVSPTGFWVAMKVSVTEQACPVRVLVEDNASWAERHGDSASLLAAGARSVIWVTVSRLDVRQGLAAGLRIARAMRPAGVVIESTSAGIHLRRPSESWFVAGTLPWKPWAWRHLIRADHVLTPDGAGGWFDAWPTQGDDHRLSGAPERAQRRRTAALHPALVGRLPELTEDRALHGPGLLGTKEASGAAPGRGGRSSLGLVPMSHSRRPVEDTRVLQHT